MNHVLQIKKLLLTMPLLLLFTAPCHAQNIVRVVADSAHELDKRL